MQGIVPSPRCAITRSARQSFPGRHRKMPKHVLPFTAINSRTPVKRGFSLPRQPDFPRSAPSADSSLRILRPPQIAAPRRQRSSTDWSSPSQFWPAREILDPSHPRDRPSAVVGRGITLASIQPRLFIRQPAVANGIVVRIVLEPQLQRPPLRPACRPFLQNIHPLIQRMQAVRAGNNQRRSPAPQARDLKEPAVRRRSNASSEPFARARNRLPTLPRQRSQKEFTP